MSTGADVLKLIKEKGIKYVDLRFTDTKGKEQHVTVPHPVVDDAFFEDGKVLRRLVDRRLEGHQRVRHDPDAGLVDRDARPVLRGADAQPALRHRRAVDHAGLRARPALAGQARRGLPASTGIADAAFFGPENEFFIFDDVRRRVRCNGASTRSIRTRARGTPARRSTTATSATVRASRAATSRCRRSTRYQDLRSAMCGAMEQLGMIVEVHHHEVATAGQARSASRPTRW